MPQTRRLQRLLAATDLSLRSDKAFDRAVQLARENQAHLTVLHVIPDELQPAFADVLKSQARAGLEKQVAQALAAGPVDVSIAVKGGLDAERILRQVAEGAVLGDFSVEVRIETGSIYDLINEMAAEEGADLVICGSHHKLVIGEEWLGSTIDRVLRFGSRPVLIVKTTPTGAYENIVVAVDFSDPSAQALEFAAAAFPNATFTLINAVESSFSGFLKGAQSSQEALQRQKGEVSRFAESVLSDGHGSPDLKMNVEVRQGPPAEVLREYVAGHATDLVVVGAHGRTGLRRAILGSVAEDVIAGLPCDVLAVRPHGA
jgi:nucleotide-binding universal stress UspA family protein